MTCWKELQLVINLVAKSAALAAGRDTVVGAVDRGIKGNEEH